MLLDGYGGYNVSMKPFFIGSQARVWLDQGGITATASLRGGAEYGEEWHKEGNLTRKQNVFDDFIACAQYLVEHKYTSPAHLAILGGSNGGLLMGAAFTQRPDLFRAVVSFVGIYDMLRVELDPNGAFNVTEYGTVKDPDQFKALYAYSPYHHVKDGTAYPAILFLTGENDHRVNPMQSRKMTARLQAANVPIIPSCCAPRPAPATGSAPPSMKKSNKAQTSSAFCWISWESSTPRRESNQQSDGNLGRVRNSAASAAVHGAEGQDSRAQRRERHIWIVTTRYQVPTAGPRSTKPALAGGVGKA